MEYFKNYNLFEKAVVYNFEGDGGLGDYIKFFMFVLEDCIKNNKRLYCMKKNIELEKYIKLKHDIYIQTIEDIDIKDIEIVERWMFYSVIHTNFTINVNDIFYFTNEVILNSKKLLYDTFENQNYVSIHIRLGDKYLETDPKYIICGWDTRNVSEEKLYNLIESIEPNKIFLCCDNHKYKLKIKEKYPNIMITNCNIGHTGLINTTNEQILDAVTEFYILTKSNMIYALSYSGFSIMASKFNNILINNL